MPSSSTRSTYIESAIRNITHITTVHLDAANDDRVLDFFIAKFANVLDVPPSEMNGHLQYFIKGLRMPWYGGGSFTISHDFHQLYASCLQKKRSELFWEASMCCAEVGSLLFRVGREHEARQWCEWGERVQKRSVQEVRREEADDLIHSLCYDTDEL